MSKATKEIKRKIYLIEEKTKISVQHTGHGLKIAAVSCNKPAALRSKIFRDKLRFLLNPKYAKYEIISLKLAYYRGDEP